MAKQIRSKRDQDVHVVPVPAEGLWKVTFKGTVASMPNQKTAIVVGRQKAKDNSCDLVIHGRDGKIRRKDSYGNDPIRRKG